MRRAVLMSVAFVIVPAACLDPSGSEPPHIEEAEWTLTATVSGGESFVPSFGMAERHGDLVVISAMHYRASGSRRLELRVEGVTGPGTYDLTALSNRAVYTDQAIAGYWKADMGQGSGTITISELTTERVVATFTFTAVATVLPGADSRMVSGSLAMPF